MKIVAYTLAICLAINTKAFAFEETWRTKLIEGNVDLERQKLSAAEDCYRESVNYVQRVKHSNDDVVACLEKLADCLTLEDKANESIPLYKRSLHILESKYGKDSPKIIPILFSLGSIFEAEGDPKSAMRLYQRALAINEKNYGPFSPAVAHNLHRLGRATFSAGQPEEAEQHYKQSLTILMQQPALKSSWQLESLLSDYSDLLRKKDNSDQALVSDFENEMLKDNLGNLPRRTAVPPSDWQKQVFEQAHNRSQAQDNEEQQVLLRGFKQPFSSSTLAPAYKEEAEVLHNQHAYKEEEELYERMIAIDVKTLGSNHPAVADDLSGLALLLVSQHRLTEARPLLLRALAIYETVYGNDNLLTSKTCMALANIESQLGNTEDAKALYGKILQQGKLALDPNNIETARILNELAFLYYRQGRLNDACTTYQWALATTEAAVGENNELVGACLKDYANVLRSLGRTNEADRMQNRAELIISKAK